MSPKGCAQSPSATGVNVLGNSPFLRHQYLSFSQIHSPISGTDPSHSAKPRPGPPSSPKCTPVARNCEGDNSSPPPKPRRSPPRASSTEHGFFETSKFLFTPAPTPSVIVSRSAPKLPQKKSNSSPVLHSPTQPYHTRPGPSYSPYSKDSLLYMQPDSEDDREEDDVIYTSWHNPAGNIKTTTSLRTRIFGGGSNGVSRGRDKPKTITTTPGQVCAGETETEADEPPHHLPTSRIIPSSGPLIPPHTLQQRLTPLLFEFSRLLSIVPAVLGTIYNIFHIFYPPTESITVGRRPPERVDFFVSALWSILTGYQCLRLTTGLLTRWRLYYPPLPTLIRLLALQAICWPAAHFTLKILEHEKRPVIVWAVIGSTTCTSRSVQIWVTSNLWWERRDPQGSTGDAGDVGRDGSNGNGTVGEVKGGYWKRWGGGKWGGRRWDWKEVGVKCVLPAGVVYFVMAWAEAFRRELGGC